MAASNNTLSSSVYTNTGDVDALSGQVFQAVKSGDAETLNEILEKMDRNQRGWVLETDISLAPVPDVFGYAFFKAAKKTGNLDCVKTLLKYSGIEVPGKFVEFFSSPTYSYYLVGFAAAKGHTDVLSWLVENGADVNASKTTEADYLVPDADALLDTPLMNASENGHVNAVTFLVEHGANMDLQDKDGNTALHHAARGNAIEVYDKLFTLGASQMNNNQQLTPLLLASNECKVSMVEYLIRKSECTKEQKIDALELLGASILFNDDYTTFETGLAAAFEYMKRGMEERFQDPSHHLIKQPMESVEAYQNRKESQTPEELTQIEDDEFAIIMESLIIRERILGACNVELLGPIVDLAQGYRAVKNACEICIALCYHAMEIAQNCNQSVNYYVDLANDLLPEMVEGNYFLKTKKFLLKVLDQTILEYEKQMEKSNRKFGDVTHSEKVKLNELLDGILRFLQFFAKDDLCGELSEEDNLYLSVLLRKLSCLNPCDQDGNTLLHLAAAGKTPSKVSYDYSCSVFGFPCVRTVKFLLSAGFNIDATNNNGDTPLHRAAAFNPHDWRKFHLITDMLNVLSVAGAHLDFTNNDGKTAMDTSINVRAYHFLFYRKTLELKCIAARAVKKFGLPYLGVVPKTLEKYISMH